MGPNNLIDVQTVLAGLTLQRLYYFERVYPVSSERSIEEIHLRKGSAPKIAL